jgi:hypothetical protein
MGVTAKSILRAVGAQLGVGRCSFRCADKTLRPISFASTRNLIAAMNAIADFRTPHAAPEGGYEWEDLPSLTGVVLRRHVPHASFALAAGFVEQARERLRSEPSCAPVWTETMPAIFDPLIPSAPLADTRIDGLAAREINDPDVFRHLFEAAVAKASKI